MLVSCFTYDSKRLKRHFGNLKTPISFLQYCTSICMVTYHFIHLYCVFSALCWQLLMDSQMNRRSFKKWPLTLQPMKWLHTWQSGTKRYVGAKHVLLVRQWARLISLTSCPEINHRAILKGVSIPKMYLEDRGGLLEEELWARMHMCVFCWSLGMTYSWNRQTMSGSRTLQMFLLYS